MAEDIFPSDKSKPIRFREPGLEVQGGAGVGYLIISIRNGNRTVGSRSVRVGPWPDKQNTQLDSMADSLVVYASKQRLTVFSEEDSSFEIVTELPPVNLAATGITSSSMSISWDGTEFDGVTFKVVLSSAEETIEYQTNESHINASGLAGGTLYEVSLYKE